jgi:DegV family protein with EDD domain
VSKVHIVTDSALRLPTAVSGGVSDAEIADRLDITIVPLTVRIAGEDFQDGIDLDHEELLLRMASERIHPQIVGPTAHEFRRVYGRVTRRTDQIISLHSSAALSLVCGEAERATHSFMGRYDIAVVDSETFSLGLGILAEAAARLAEEGVPLGAIVRHIRGMIRHIYISLTTDTLDYLEYAGLISASQAILGTMLDNKPSLAVERGRIIPMEKVIGRAEAIGKLADFANEFPHIAKMAILQSTPYATEETEALRDDVEVTAEDGEFPILLYGPLLASHVGPDALGLIVYEGYGGSKGL